jgi:hypothetical protein
LKLETSVAMSKDDLIDELPIACSLAAADLKTRQSELVALGRQCLISVDRTDHGPVILHFKADSATRAELRRIVAAEAECCAFLQMKLTEGASLNLAIEGPPEAGPVIEELVSAFEAEAPR